MSATTNVSLMMIVTGVVVIVINIGAATIIPKTKINIPSWLEPVIEWVSAITMTIAIAIVVFGAIGLMLYLLGVTGKVD